MSGAMLLLAVLALAAGPLVHAAARRLRWAFSAVDGFVLAAVGALVVLQVAPRAVAEGGSGAVVALGLGLFSPLLLNRLRIPLVRARGWMISVGLVGLALHAMMDGAALAAGRSDLAWAIVVHRIPAGIFVWWLVRPNRGPFRATAVLIGLAGCTVLGFGLAQTWALQEGYVTSLFEAFVAGALLHVLADHGPELHGHREEAHSTGAELAGTALAILLFWLMPEEPGHHGADGAGHAYGQRFLDLVLEASPALLLGYAAAGAFAGFLPRGTVGWLGGGGAFSQAARGVAFGGPIPICSCGVLPVYESLARRATPATAGLAFLVATPELGVESVLLSIPLLGPQLAATRVVAAVAIAMVVGVWLGSRVGRLNAEGVSSVVREPTTFLERLGVAYRFGFRELVDHTMGWIILGIAIAALFDPGSLQWLDAVPTILQVALFALASIPMYVCASGATPLAAALIAAGASPGSALAFLLAGPATNVTTFGVLSRLHGRATALTFGVVVFAGAVGAGLAFDAWAPVLTVPAAGEEHAHGPLAWVCAGILALVTVGSLYRLGPRHLMMTVLRPLPRGGASHDHDHDPGHDHGDEACGHDHEPVLG